MPFQLPELPYKKEALAPVISTETIEFHYGKHHLAYINNLNALIAGTEYENSDLESIIRKAGGPVFNNAAQIWNHTFYFESFCHGGKPLSAGTLANAINSSFGSFSAFQEQFSKAAATLFGSGWAWLVKNKDGALQITQEPNAGNPMKKDLTPLMTCDVWEHAYYIDYRNRRPDYIKAFWEILNWEIIQKRY
jgi:Fe-Mn family superoxide dismutase